MMTDWLSNYGMHAKHKANHASNQIQLYIFIFIHHIIW